jgi:O-acetyl-ADP-ribose deacetylase
MTKRKHHGVTIECVQGNIANQPDMEAIVNAANAELRTGGGVAGAIHRAAGPGLEAECRPLAPIRPGQAVITGAHNLPNRHVIHCLGPVYGRDQPSEALLASCYRNALHLAEQNAIASIAFPAISTGIFGYPIEAAAAIAVSTLLRGSREPGAPELIRLCLFAAADLEVYGAALAAAREDGR